jgi:hypothetical protein
MKPPTIKTLVKTPNNKDTVYLSLFQKYTREIDSKIINTNKYLIIYDG